MYSVNCCVYVPLRFFSAGSWCTTVREYYVIFFVANTEQLQIYRFLSSLLRVFMPYTIEKL